MMQSRTRLFALVAGLILAGPLHAGSNSVALRVTADVPSNCVITVSNLAFGAYDPLVRNATQEVEASTDVRMLCTRSSRATITIDIGRNARGNDRAMAAGMKRVTYQLYRDSGHTETWSSGSDGLQLVSEGIHKPRQVMVYGRIPPGQEVASGIYTDVVTATVDF
jgi:spore coat protein U domain-containing protein, fimbrial subunit CupE1/2/3/6